MNSERMTEALRGLIETIGWEVRAVHHPSSLRVEFTVCPPLTATTKQVMAMLEQLFSVPFYGSTVGNCFSSDHDCGMSYIRLRQEGPLPNFPEDQPYYSSMRAAERKVQG